MSFLKDGHDAKTNTMDSQSYRLATGEKPKPLDLSHLFSEVTKHRIPSKMKEYYKFFQIPGIGNLAGGLPNVSLFPFDTLEAQAARPERWTPTPNYPGDDDFEDLSRNISKTTLKKDNDPPPSAHIGVPKASNETNPLKKIDLASALQYGQASGYPPLLSWIRQFSRECLHPNVPYEGGPEVILTVGSTDGFSKTLDLFVNNWSPERDDVRERPGMLCESFVYANVLSQAAPHGVQTVAVVADEGGMVAHGKGGLVDVLENWDEEKGRRPHLLYTVSMGHNPTGIVMSASRRAEIYAACSKYDVIIVEDDPYWYLQFPSAESSERESRGDWSSLSSCPSTNILPSSGEKSSGFAFLDSLTQSFLSHDTDGRVVRLDTFSKTIAPGCRLGWITAQPELVERYLRIAETSTQQPSGFVQSMVAELLMGPDATDQKALFSSRRDGATFTGWKMDGWVRWLEGLRGQYERRMTRMCRILDAGADLVKSGSFVGGHEDAEWGVVTKTPLYSYSWPRGGMFVWMRMHLETHPLWQARHSRGEARVDGTQLSMGLMMFLTRKPFLVLVSPGMMFSADEEVRQKMGWAYYRLCFAAETEEKVDTCSERFVQGVHRFWRIKDVRVLEEILETRPVAVAAVGEEEGMVRMGDLGMPFGC